MNVTGGDTNVSVYFQMRLTAGGDATGLTITDFDLSYTRNGAATATKADVTDLGSANAAHTDNGGFEVDPTDCPGLHRFDFPDAAFAAGVRDVLCTIKHTSCFTETLRVQIDPEVSVTEWNGVKLTTTNPLPNAAADAAGGLPISDAGGLDLDTQLAATNEITAARMGALTDWIDGGRLDLILDAIVADTNELQTDWANGGRLDLIIDAILADTAVIGTPSDLAGSGATIAGNFQDMTTDGLQIYNRTTDSLQAIRDHIGNGTNLTEAGGTGDHLTAIPWNASWDAEVQSECTDALNAYDPPTNAEMEARTLVAASYFDPAADTVANVTTVGSVTTKTGYSLVSTGLDLVLIDGKALPVAMQHIAASTAGIVSGAGTGTETFKGLDKTTTRMVVTADSSGNRSAITYTDS